METVADFLFLGSKITADGDCSHEIKICLLLGRKAMTNLDSLLKSRDITLPTTIHLVKAMVFPVVMYRCESWTVKKAEHQRSDAFKLCWRRPYINMNQPQVYISPPSWTSLPPSTPSHPSRLSQSTGLRSLCYTGSSHLLSILHMVMYIFPCYSLNLSHPLLPPLCAQFFSPHVCISIAALQMGSSVPSF